MQIEAQMTVLPDAELRRSPRRPVNFVGWIRDAELPMVSVEIVEIAQHGCKLRTGGTFAVGATLALKITGLNGLQARVVWSAEGETGCEFSNPLHPADLALLLKLQQKPRKKVLFRSGPDEFDSQRSAGC